LIRDLKKSEAEKLGSWEAGKKRKPFGLYGFERLRRERGKLRSHEARKLGKRDSPSGWFKRLWR